MEPAPLQESSSPALKAEPSGRKEEPEALKASGLANGRDVAAASETEVANAAAANERPRPRARAPAEPKAGPAARKLGSQQAQPAGGRGPSLGAPQLRTGEEIWQLNMQLSKMAEQLADPEDSKPGRRKQKSLNLAEDLQKRWGGTYGEMLDKNFDSMEVEERPAPKYEPPLFLEDVSVADDDGDTEPEARPVEPGGKDSAAQPSAAVAAPGKGSPSSAGAAPPASARARKGAAAATNGASGRVVAPAGAKKTATGAAAAAAAPTLASVAEGAQRPKKSRRDADTAGRDTGSDADADDGQSDPGQGCQPDVEAQPLPRRGGRKTKAATAAEAATKAAPQRPAPRRTARGAGAAAAAATTAVADDLVTEDQGPGDAMDLLPPATTTVAASAPSVAAANLGSRNRRSHMPTSTAFGSTIKPLLAPAPAAAATDCMDDPVINGGGAEAGTAAKRARDAGVTVDEKLRLNKASRIEQQQAKELADLRRQYADLELKYKGSADQVKQLQAELAAEQKRSSNADAERRREVNESHRKIEKLDAKLKERDDKVANLEDELKQAKAREVKMTRQVEQFVAEHLAPAQQQADKMIKGWRS
ncbi:hypothetical protein PLESTB_000184000 [Pleodorina starrii]|uniref:Uncharacterized protein n=1 Tax=Pleodorina starrii TaxID=330485 RepID=A0A9W6BCB2_9CHLO|nr:hypothetical protein PLESTB_000184000 [Pleodorina starrii]GLC66090.1 hypothetical protein PLESTF_000383700 [Pleodorina starrii]